MIVEGGASVDRGGALKLMGGSSYGGGGESLADSQSCTRSPYRYARGVLCQ